MRLDIGNIGISRENVLSAMKCTKGSPVCDRINAELDKVLREAAPDVRAYIAHEDSFLYVLVTAGGKISEYSRSLMDEGECLGGLVADNVGDEALFGADAAVSDRIREYLAGKSLGVKRRLEAPDGFPLERHREIIEKTGAEGISLTDAYMFNPQKTLAYVLELTEDEKMFKAQHDCAKCPNLNCPRRSVRSDKMEAVTEHGAVMPKTVSDILCIDIGTTTIAFERVRNGERSVITAINRQRSFGADVISRIEASNAGRGKELKNLICYQLIEGVGRLYKGGSVPEKIIISANTVMVHLLMGYPCVGLGAYPFKPHNTGRIETDFRTLTGGGVICPVTIIPAISAFVGGDIVSGLYMCDFDISERVNMFVDLGTNGEMAIGKSDGLLAASTAAGPAFEGGRISCGTGSVDGALSAVDLKNGIITTINDKEPVGICGTGIVELTSELLDAGMMDETGLLRDEFFERGVSVCKGVTFTQKDIREVQTAKAAVRAGIELLIKRYGCEYEDISSVYIAGGFGFRLNIKKACRVGLIPPELEKKCIAVGNSSLGGAVRYGFNADASSRAERIVGMSTELVLAADDEFNQMYLENMNFS